MAMTDEGSSSQFRATAKGAQGFGATPRAALDALLELNSESIDAPIVIWPFNRGDAFFSDSQQQRLQELKSRRGSLSAPEQEELHRLVEESFDATIARSKTTQPQKT